MFLCKMMTSSNGNIFRYAGPLCGEFSSQRPVARSFDVFFDPSKNKCLSAHSWGWWFETPSRSLWRHWGGWCFSYIRKYANFVYHYCHRVGIWDIWLQFSGLQTLPDNRIAFEYPSMRKQLNAHANWFELVPVYYHMEWDNDVITMLIRGYSDQSVSSSVKIQIVSIHVH